MPSLLKVSFERFYTPFIVALSLAGMAAIAYSTTWGPGVGSDSVYYILSADYWVKGEGFGLPWGSGRFLVYAGNPPFYPFLVAGLELIGLRLIPAARLICILAFGWTILTVGLLGYRVSRSYLLSTGLSLLILSSSLQFELFTRAISEPVFFATGLSGALWLLWYLDTGHWRELIPAALLLSAAFLTRYPGFSLALAGGLALLFLSDHGWRKRWLHALVYGSIVTAPMLIWLGWSYSQTGEVGERVLAPFSALPSKLIAFRLSAAKIAWGWIPWIGQQPVDYAAQKRFFGVTFLLFAILAFGVLARHLRAKPLRQSNRLLLRWVAFFGLFSLIFTLTYMLGHALTLPTPDLDERLFSPLFLGGWFTVTGAWLLVMRTGSKLRRLEALIWILFLAFILQNLPRTLSIAHLMHQEGFGYTGKAWSQSRLVAAVRDLPQGIPIITNEADAVLFLTGRPTVWLPDVIASQPAPSFTRFGDSPENLPEEIAFRQRGGALVIFPSIYNEIYPLYYERTEERLRTLTDGLAVYLQIGPAEGIFFYHQALLP